MTHSLAEPKHDDDTAVPQQRVAQQQRDTGEPTAQTGPTGTSGTASQGPVAMAGLVFGTRGPAKDGEDGEDHGPSPLALPGDITFEWTGWEAFGFPPEIKAAQAQYSQTMTWLAFLHVQLVPTMPEQLRPALVANLNAAQRMLLALARKPVPVADRFEAIHAIAMWSKAVDTTVDTARRERDAALVVQDRQAAELKAAVEMVERLEAQEAARLEAEAEARRTAEALERQLKEEADRAAAAKLALEQAKAEAERIAQEEAAAAKAELERKAQEAEQQRKQAEQQEAERQRLEAEKQAQEKAERERLEAQAARDKEQQEQQERDRIEALEQQEKSRRALFGDNQPAFDAALAAATRIADDELAQTMLVLEAQRDQAQEALAKAKPKHNKGTKKKSTTSEPITTAAIVEPAKPAHETAFAEGAGKANAAHGVSVASRVDKYGALASSSKGMGLAPPDLGWAIATSNGSVPVAEALVDLCARGPDGVSIARDIAHRPDIIGHVSLCVTLLNAGVLMADVAKGAVVLHSLDQTSAKWVLSVLGSTTSVTDATSFLERHKKHKLAMLIGSSCGVGYANDDLIASVITSKSTQSVVSWLLTNGSGDLALLAKAITSKDLKVDDVQAVVEPFVPGFALAAVLEILTTFPQQILVIPALLAKAPPGLPQMVTMWLRLSASDTANPFTVAAMETEARLMAGLAGVVTCTDGDVFYVGSGDRQAHNQKADARTGFLMLPLCGPTYELHVHWENNGTRELTSMHVQINRVNGTELNQIMNFFPMMIAAAVVALNAKGLTKGGKVKGPKGR